MTTLENFYFGNINPSEYKQSKDKIQSMLKDWKARKEAE